MVTIGYSNQSQQKLEALPSDLRLPTTGIGQASNDRVKPLPRIPVTSTIFSMLAGAFIFTMQG